MCGESLTWLLDDNGVLTIEGNGDMYDYDETTTVPWSGYADKIEKIVVGNNITKIGKRAFYECNKVKSFDIPKKISSIGTDAFYNCTELIKVNYSGEIEDWCNILFEGIYSNPLYYAKHLYINDEEIVDLVIPGSVTEIGKYTFVNCEGFLSVTIPINVTSIGSSAFSGCKQLIKIYYNAKLVEDLDSISNVFKNVGISGAGTDVIFGDSVERIPSYLFSSFLLVDTDTNNIKSITIGKNVIYIGVSAFSGCKQLTKIYYNAKSVEDLTTSSDVFNDAGTSGEGIDVIFGDSVKKIPNYLFKSKASRTNKAPNIKFVTVANGVTSIGEKTFSGCNNFTIKCAAGSYAETYAKDNNIPYEIIEFFESFYVSRLPNKREYNANESFDSTGMVITATQKDGTKKELTDYTISGFDATKAGIQTVTVSYGNCSATFNVAVGRKFDSGDTDGDGIISDSDGECLIDAILGEDIPLTSAFDTNSDGEIDVLDFIALKLMIESK